MVNRLQNITIRKEKDKSIFKYLKYPEIPISINDIYITTRIGDRLDLLADRF